MFVLTDNLLRSWGDCWLHRRAYPDPTYDEISAGGTGHAEAVQEYRAEIFYHDEEQQRIAEQSKAKLVLYKPFKEPIVTKITAASEFYPAEEYHQYYYRKNPDRFEFYHYTCGRAQRLKELWGKVLD